MKWQETVAQFYPEIAIDPSLKIYAGGLGFLAGSSARTAGRLDLPLIMVTILWRQGFYDQIIGPNGMEVRYISHDYYQDGLVEDTGVKVKVQIGQNPNVFLKVGRIKPEIFGTIPIITLDSDIPENDVLSRSNTQILYPNNNGQRLAQEIILGIGGVRALQALQIPVSVYHLNEGYTVLAAVELLSQKIAQGLNFIDALEEVRKQVVFTSHTPEIISELHDLDLMMEMGCFPGLDRHQVIFLGGKPFNHTVAALRLSRKANTVSKLHAKTTNQMLAWVEGKCPIISITNGVDALYWQWPEFQNIQTIDEIKEAKRKYKKLLLDYIEEQTGKIFSEDVLTIVWARRFVEYKRPWLLYYDRGWFERLLKSDKIQVIYAGKPHPADLGMINAWNEIWQMSKILPNLVILTGYDLGLSKLLKGGADLWLNTPRRPREACGTSWISAMMNCTLVISSRDGGVLEGVTPDNGFLFGVDYPCQNEGEQDAKDFADLQFCLQMAMEIFYKKPDLWYKMALTGKKSVEENFSSEKMLKNYFSQLYSN